MLQVNFENTYYSNELLKKEIEIANFAVVPIGDYLEELVPFPDFDEDKELDTATNVGYEG